MNLELLDLGEQVLASRSIRIQALSSSTEISPGKSIVSIPLVLVVSIGRQVEVAEPNTSADGDPLLDAILEEGVPRLGEGDREFTSVFGNVNATDLPTKSIESPEFGKNLDTRVFRIEPKASEAHRSGKTLLIWTGLVAVLMSGVVFETLPRLHKAPVKPSTTSNIGADAVNPPKPPRPQMGDTAVLSQFSNLTGDRALDGLDSRIYDAAPLKSPSVKILSSEQVSEILFKMNRNPNESLTPGLAREVCLHANAGAVITGSISADDAHYKIAATAINCQTGKTLGTAEGVADKFVGVSTDVKRAYVSNAMRNVLDQLLRKLLKPPS
jgi:hypothetical protein